MPFLLAPPWATIEQSGPIICVDLIPVRWDADCQVSEVGLILRDSPLGEVWVNSAGACRYSETVNMALLRYLHETLANFDVVLPIDTRLDYVCQWFPDDVTLAVPEGIRFGRDPRKHATTIYYCLDLLGELEIYYCLDLLGGLEEWVPMVVGDEGAFVGFFDEPVVPDSGGEGQYPGDDAGIDAGDVACAVASESQLTFHRVEH